MEGEYLSFYVFEAVTLSLAHNLFTIYISMFNDLCNLNYDYYFYYSYRPCCTCHSVVVNSPAEAIKVSFCLISRVGKQTH